MKEHIEFSQFLNTQKQLREEASQITAQAVERTWGDMEQFPRLLDVVERFNQNSGTLGGGSANALLLYAQCPIATRLGSFEDWKQEQAFVKRGEKGLKIYVRSPGKEDPKTHRTRYFYNVEHRFDVSQVNRTPDPEVVAWSDPLDIVKAVVRANCFGIQYDSTLPDGVDSVYIPDLREVRVRDGQDAAQMCSTLLVEFCHYAQHRVQGKAYGKSPESNFVALCGAYVLARRFGVSTDFALFQREVFPEIPSGNIQEKCGAVKNLLSSVIRSSGMAGQEIQRGIVEIEKNYGQVIYTPRYRPEEVRAV